MSLEIDDEILAEAIDAFFSVITKRHPEIESGDLPPIDTLAFERACRTVAAAWFSSNQPMRDTDKIAKLLRDGGIANAYVEQTGGGCATIYAGKGPNLAHDGAGESRYALVAGPGSFRKRSFCARANFSYSADDDGESTPIQPQGDDESTAREMLAFIRAHGKA